LRYEMNSNAFVNLTIEDIPERMAFTRWLLGELL